MRRFGHMWMALTVAAVMSATPVFGEQNDGSDRPPSSGRTPAAQDAATALPPITISAGELADNPERFYGRQVEVSAEVEDVYSAHTFTLDEDKLFSTGRDVLVFNPFPDATVIDDSVVTVRGTLVEFARADIERDYDLDWRELTPREELVVAWEQRPVLIATSILTPAGAQLVHRWTDEELADMRRSFEERSTTTAPPSEMTAGERAEIAASAPQARTESQQAEPERSTEAAPERAQQESARVPEEAETPAVKQPQEKTIAEDRTPRPVDRDAATEEPAAGTEREAAGTAGARAPITDVSRLTGSVSPDELEGTQVRLSGVTIGKMAGDRSFWVTARNGEEVFVVVDAANFERMTDAGRSLKEGASVRISGEVRRVPGQEPRTHVTDWGLDSEDGRKLEARKVYLYASELEIEP